MTVTPYSEGYFKSRMLNCFGIIVKITELTPSDYTLIERQDVQYSEFSGQPCILWFSHSNSADEECDPRMGQ